jgi:hypothetical protein
MRDSEHSTGSWTNAAARFYVAPLMPPSNGLKQHLAERRSISEVLAKRRFLEEALAQGRAPDRQKVARELRSGAVTVEELRARAERYRELASTLADPTVIAVVRRCAADLEAEIAPLDGQRT